jgi:hypothetical protein
VFRAELVRGLWRRNSEGDNRSGVFREGQAADGVLPSWGRGLKECESS